MNKNSPLDFVPLIVLAGGFFFIVFGAKYLLKRNARKLGREQEFNKTQANARTAALIMMGSTFIIVILFSWSTIPQGNKPIITLF